MDQRHTLKSNDIEEGRGYWGVLRRSGWPPMLEEAWEGSKACGDRPLFGELKNGFVVVGREKRCGKKWENKHLVGGTHSGCFLEQFVLYCFVYAGGSSEQEPSKAHEIGKTWNRARTYWFDGQKWPSDLLRQVKTPRRDVTFLLQVWTMVACWSKRAWDVAWIVRGSVICSETHPNSALLPPYHICTNTNFDLR